MLSKFFKNKLWSILLLNTNKNNLNCGIIRFNVMEWY